MILRKYVFVLLYIYVCAHAYIYVKAPYMKVLILKDILDFTEFF